MTDDKMTNGQSRRLERFTICILHLASRILHPASCIPHLASCILHPASCILHLASCILHPASCILHPASCILHPASCILHPASCILHPASCILHPASCILLVGCRRQKKIPMLPQCNRPSKDAIPASACGAERCWQNARQRVGETPSRRPHAARKGVGERFALMCVRGTAVGTTALHFSRACAEQRKTRQNAGDPRDAQLRCACSGRRPRTCSAASRHGRGAPRRLQPAQRGGRAAPLRLLLPQPHQRARQQCQQRRRLRHGHQARHEDLLAFLEHDTA